MRNLLFLLFFCSFIYAKGQQQLAWPILQLTTYETLNQDGQWIYKPRFPKILEDQYANERVAISGYLIPTDVSAKRYALSKNPFTSCFFCGNAGPETVILLEFEEAPGRFATDKYVAVEGILRLNKGEDGLFFTIKKTEITD